MVTILVCWTSSSKEEAGKKPSGKKKKEGRKAEMGKREEENEKNGQKCWWVKVGWLVGWSVG